MSALPRITDPDEVASLVGQLDADRAIAEPNTKFGPLLGRATRHFEEVEDRAVVSASDDEEDLAVATGVDETRV